MMGKKKPLTAATIANVHDAIAAFQELPQEVKEALSAFGRVVADLGEKYEMPPRQMACALASLIGVVAIVEVREDVHDDAGFDEFVVFAQDAVNAMVAMFRIEAGYRPPGKH